MKQVSSKQKRAGLSEYSRILSQLKDEVKSKASFRLKREGGFRAVLKGSFVKAYEFAAFTHATEPLERAFFFAPALRGICEDFIALSFLRKKKTRPQRDELVDAKVLREIVSSSEKQNAFFAKHRPFQPVYSVPIGFTGSTGGAGLPPARNMAEAVGLEDDYDFIYAITSNVVHFNPGTLVRNAWGTSDTFEHSTSNFEPYYTEFCRIYSVYLFSRFARAFARDLTLSKNFKKALTRMEELLHAELRWPEAVTFEEMNVPGPSQLMRILVHSAYRIRNQNRRKRHDRAAEPVSKE